MKVDKYINGLLSQIMDDTKVGSMMNMITKELDHKKPRIWTKCDTVKSIKGNF